MSKLNFPNSSAPIVQIMVKDADGQMLDVMNSGQLTQAGQYLLQGLWQQVFNNAQGAYPVPTATAATPVLPNLPGTTLPQVAAQVVLLTQLMASLINNLKTTNQLGSP